MKLCRYVVSILTLMLLAGAGCGGTKVYTPPEDSNVGTVVIKNDIFSSGFYVEVDKKDAGFLRDEITLSLKPGKRTIRVYNSETTVGEEEGITTEHTFKFKMKVDKGQNEEIVLSWDDPDYNKSVGKASRHIGPDKEDRSRGGTSSPY